MVPLIAPQGAGGPPCPRALTHCPSGSKPQPVVSARFLPIPGRSPTTDPEEVSCSPAASPPASRWFLAPSPSPLHPRTRRAKDRTRTSTTPSPPIAGDVHRAIGGDVTRTVLVRQGFD